jgi:large subunit ribosomal protein L21
MYAIVDIAGQQFKVEKDKKVYINRIKGELGSKVDLNKVLFIDNEKEIKIGSPYLKDASVTGKIISHIKDKKVKIFKKKKRKGYKVFKGHRKYLTELLIEEISEKKKAKVETAEKESIKKTTEKKEISDTKPSNKEEPKKITVAAPAAKTSTGKKDTDKQPEKKGTSRTKATPVKKENTVKKTTAQKAGTKASVHGKKIQAKKGAGSKSASGKKPVAKGKSQVNKTSKEQEKTN